MTNNLKSSQDSSDSVESFDGAKDVDDLGTGEIEEELSRMKAASKQAAGKGKSSTKFKLNDSDNIVDPTTMMTMMMPKLIEKSVIIHKDENGFGLRVKGQAPVFVEHVHENGAAWRAGVRMFDVLNKINGTPVSNMDHKDVVLMFKSCTRFVGLTLLSSSNFKNPSTHLQATFKPMASQQTSGETKDQDNEGDDLSSMASFHLGSNLVALQNRSASQGASPSASRISKMENGSDNYLTNNNNNNNSNNQKIQQRNTSNSCVQLTQPIIGPTVSSTRQQSGKTTACKIISLDTNGRNDIDSSTQVCLSCRTTLSPWSSRSGYCEDCYNKTPAIRSYSAKKIDSQFTSNEQQLSPTSAGSRDATQPLNLMSKLSGRQTGGKLELDEQQVAAASTNKNLPQSASTNSLQGDNPRSGGMNVGRYHPIAMTGMGGNAPMISPLMAPIDGRSNDINGKPQVNKRLEIVREFINTEKTHTERLRYLDELFYRPLKAGNMMTSEQLRQVFSCHRTLYKIHRQIYRTLLSASYNVNAEPLVGSALLEIFEGDLKRRLEKAACVFCSAQSTNVELLNKLTRRDTKVGEFIAQVTSQQMVGRLGIKDLLASCFQRLTKYPLLLENLLKATPKPEPIISGNSNIELERLFSNNNINDNNITNNSGQLTGSSEYLNHSNPYNEDNCCHDGRNYDEHHHRPTEVEIERELNSRRMLAISLEEEREFIQRALKQSREILMKVNDSVKVAVSQNHLKEIWKRTDKYPGVPLIDITKQQVVHEGLLTLRLSKRSFDVYVLLLNDYLIILTREGQDKYRLKFFTPDGKSGMSSSSLSTSNSSQQTVYSPVFVIDEHLTTRDAATDENGFYLLCKRKDDSRIYEFASRSPAERIKWRDRIQWTIERQMSRSDRRPSCISTITKSSSEISGKRDLDDPELDFGPCTSSSQVGGGNLSRLLASSGGRLPNGEVDEPNSNRNKDSNDNAATGGGTGSNPPTPSRKSSCKPEKIEGTISYVEDDGIVLPSNMASSRALVDQAVQVSIFADTRSENIRRPLVSG